MTLETMFGGLAGAAMALIGLFAAFEKLRKFFAGKCEAELADMTKEYNELRIKHARLDERLQLLEKHASPLAGGRRVYDEDV